MKKRIWKADMTSMSHPEYDSTLEQAFVAFDTHAKEEDDNQFPTLRPKLSPEENDVCLRIPLQP